MASNTAFLLCVNGFTDNLEPWQATAIDVARRSLVDGLPVFLAEEAAGQGGPDPFEDTSLPETLVSLGIDKVCVAGAGKGVQLCVKAAMARGFHVSVLLPACEPVGEVGGWPPDVVLLRSISDFAAAPGGESHDAHVTRTHAIS